jgi:hypothetical protein
MGDYAFMRGEFRQDGKQTGENLFRGVVELEDEKYTYVDENVGKVTLQYFRGIQNDRYSDTARLVLGGLQSGEKIGETMFFKKLVTDPNLSAVSYGLEKGVDGIYRGEWVPEPYPLETLSDDVRNEYMSTAGEYGEVNQFQILTKEKLEKDGLLDGVKDFLEEGYKETANLSVHAQMIADIYEDNKQTIIAEIRRRGGQTVAGSEQPKQPEQDKLRNLNGDFTAGKSSLKDHEPDWIEIVDDPKNNGFETDIPF